MSWLNQHWSFETVLGNLEEADLIFLRWHQGITFVSSEKTHTPEFCAWSGQQWFLTCKEKLHLSPVVCCLQGCVSCALVGVQSLPAAALGWVWSSWTDPVSSGVPVLPAPLISLASCTVRPAGILCQGSEAAFPRLSRRIILCSTACMGLSELSGLLEAGFMVMLLGRRCPKLLGFILPSSAQTGVPHSLTGLILNCLPRDEVLASPAEPYFSKPSRFLYKKTRTSS